MTVDGSTSKLDSSKQNYFKSHKFQEDKHNAKELIWSIPISNVEIIINTQYTHTHKRRTRDSNTHQGKIHTNIKQIQCK